MILFLWCSSSAASPCVIRRRQIVFSSKRLFVVQYWSTLFGLFDSYHNWDGVFSYCWCSSFSFRWVLPVCWNLSPALHCVMWHSNCKQPIIVSTCLHYEIKIGLRRFMFSWIHCLYVDMMNHDVVYGNQKIYTFIFFAIWGPFFVEDDIRSCHRGLLI